MDRYPFVMTTMRRLRVAWEGLGGLPGLSTFYYGVATPNVSDAVTFFNAIKALFPSGLQWTIPSSGDEIDDATGQLTGGWVGSGGGSVSATGGSAGYAAGVGTRVRWDTLVIAGGRRVRGSTFLCPLVTGCYDGSGTISTTNLTTFQTAASAFAASGVAKGIWHRPVNGSGGLYAAINTATVPDKVTMLRSRRD
jgi:hypothetical protein